MSEPFDWELDMARSLGPMEVAELLNKREEAAKQKARADASGIPSAALDPSVTQHTRDRGSDAETRTSRDESGSKEPGMSDEEAWEEADHYLRKWGHWNLKGAERVTPMFPKGYRSQFAPPNLPPPPPDESDLAAYVERTPGFGKAQESLWRVYVLGWEPGKEALRTVEVFRKTLADRIRTMPWKPAPRFPEVCEADRQRHRQTDEEWAKSGRVNRSRARKHAGE